MFRVGIIGIGNIGSTHVNSFLSGRVKNAKIVLESESCCLSNRFNGSQVKSILWK